MPKYALVSLRKTSAEDIPSLGPISQLYIIDRHKHKQTEHSTQPVIKIRCTCLFSFLIMRGLCFFTAVIDTFFTINSAKYQKQWAWSPHFKCFQRNFPTSSNSWFHYSSHTYKHTHFTKHSLISTDTIHDMICGFIKNGF